MKGNTAQRLKTTEEAFQEGFMRGVSQSRKEAVHDGFVAGWQKACDHFLEVLYHLDEAKDIGPKRYQTIIERFGYKDKSEFGNENRWREEDGFTDVSETRVTND
jgi:hypothetical protein